MNIIFRTALALLAAIPVAASAQPTLRYNYEYVCNNQRVVVGHCRSDSDIPGSVPTRPESDYCAVYYPDRPRNPNSSEIPDTVLRSNVMSMLDACGAFGSAGTDAASRAKAVPGSAARPSPAAPPASTQPGAASKAQTPRQFCDQVQQLKALAPQGFRSIDLGQLKGHEAGIHVSSLQLPGSECLISQENNKSNFIYCSWSLHGAATDAQFRATGQKIADCLNLRPDWMTFGDGISQLELESSHVLFELETLPDDGGLMLSVMLSQP
jgi:hypothetical protein